MFSNKHGRNLPGWFGNQKIGMPIYRLAHEMIRGIKAASIMSQYIGDTLV